ncbi:DUF4148 domain-containing protein [Paraburkholderia sp. BCC1885]|uniref:DUF4148 domain-containing protein n=1 Tax=Paraburkholderia sp. BCC1885 TaxID=2562669 RepID=UPI001183E2E2|nr:DUF4148 domain-containing protein [Paraburkholderia sp. BCC1885]
MKFATRSALMALLLAGSASAMAAPGLTAQQCNAYPFTHVKGEITHRQLMRELGELEAVGYDPTGNDNNYPNDIETAEKKLQAEYRADCKPAASMTNAQGTGSAAMPAATDGANPAS